MNAESTMRCFECDALKGDLHEIFCTRERCPFCGGQLVSCGCISSVLELSPSDQQALDEYVDDSVDPLKSVNERWEKTLQEKGRVPFT